MITLQIPDGLAMYVDDMQFGTVEPGEGFYTSGRKHAVPHAAHWLKGTVMAPLDEMVGPRETCQR